MHAIPKTESDVIDMDSVGNFSAWWEGWRDVWEDFHVSSDLGIVKFGTPPLSSGEHNAWVHNPYVHD